MPTKVLQVFSPQNSTWQFNLSSPSEAPFAFPSTWYLDPQVLTSQPWGASHGEEWAGGRPPLPGQGSSQPTPGDTTRTCPLGLLLPRASRHMSSCQLFSGRLLSAEKTAGCLWLQDLGKVTSAPSLAIQPGKEKLRHWSGPFPRCRRRMSSPPKIPGRDVRRWVGGITANTLLAAGNKQLTFGR